MPSDPRRAPTDAPQGYRTPPAPIPEILDAPLLPAISLSPDRRVAGLFGRRALVPLAELAEPEVGLAGFRLNPATRSPSREGYYHALELVDLDGGGRREVALPRDARLSSPRWSPTGAHIAFTHTTEAGVELWLAEVSTGRARKLSDARLVSLLGSPFSWFPDGSALLARRVPPGQGAAPAPAPTPTGPTVRESGGAASPARTYQDLLASEHDERLFEHYAASELVVVPLEGEPRVIGPAAIYTDASIAPDGRHLLVEWITRPFSHLVPWYRFPSVVEVWDAEGRPVRRVAELPLAEQVPTAIDAVPTGPRSLQWRSDAPATLVWVEALDGGDPRAEAALRDRVLLWPAPFEGEPRELISLEQRYAAVRWGDARTALVYSRWWNTRRVRTWLLAPDDPGAPPRLLWDRSQEDRYSHPGSPVTTRDARGQTVLLQPPEAHALYLDGEGASPRGDYPFLDRLHLPDGATTRLWQCEDPWYEAVVTLLDARAERAITRRESAAEPPNLVIRSLRTGEARPLTDYRDPAPQLAGIGREILRYPREDGVQLSGTLYTPPGYDPQRDGPLPLLMWAYPREYLDADAAGQVDDSPNRFSRPVGASHLFLLTQGYAILDGPAMPVVGAVGTEPNDRYVEELVMGARAAVEAVVGLGVAERGRIGVGGHSYGAAMTAMLLAHSDLFQAGIARSGAYNRTLTPFGFQYEQRSYWEAPEVYHAMAPFSHAHRLRHPLLLIHGEADNNTGTYPMQSERFYNALKGHGATVRYVSLPLESHGYRARESVGHVLWEMIEWMDRYVKRDGRSTQ